MKRERADLLLVRRGLLPSRERARAAILAGDVFANGQRVLKAGEQLPADAEIVLRKAPPYVSRGGVKLAGALDFFDIEPAGRVAADIGASTGGFTDVLLKRGVDKVYAIDVGYGQLAWSIRNDPRVVVMERTNIRRLDPSRLDTQPDIVTVDVSFISVRKILDSLIRLLSPGGDLIVLVKPQFEGERRQVGRGGVVRDPKTHKEILGRLACEVRTAGLALESLTYSPIKGADGNIEYWLHARKGQAGRNQAEAEELVERVVEEAHATLQR
ncbi:MAG: TlyA family RNA methyltransferase [Actinobacteria bacterium]|nr:MAG: TlyA family RNA methyltransferase [Actinomycetota bacterium]